jgi:hypothetical protein
LRNATGVPAPEETKMFTIRSGARDRKRLPSDGSGGGCYIIPHMPAALQFATEVTAYLNKQYALNMKLGVGTLDQPIIQWHFE